MSACADWRTKMEMSVCQDHWDKVQMHTIIFKGDDIPGGTDADEI
jgi:hypothetical protein